MTLRMTVSLVAVFFLYQFYVCKVFIFSGRILLIFRNILTGHFPELRQRSLSPGLPDRPGASHAFFKIKMLRRISVIKRCKQVSAFKLKYLRILSNPSEKKPQNHFDSFLSLLASFFSLAVLVAGFLVSLVVLNSLPIVNLL